MPGILSQCSSGGCGAKMAPGELSRLLDALPRPVAPDPALIVGYDSRDDAAVYKLSSDTAIISTVDFFPPMVADPFLFGRIAAANALSDVYAMGGTPLFALNLVCFPEKADKTDLGQILAGGASALAEASIPLAGGHSIHDREIKYGLAVTGRAHPDRILRNIGGRPGDSLILTKPLGTGIILAAQRVSAADPAHYAAATAGMARLNRAAAETVARFPVTAATDVTGFGLLTHLAEMAGENVTVEVWPRALPVLPGALDYAAEFLLTAAGQRNRRFMEDKLDPAELARLPAAVQEILFDPQTSGGLVLAVPEMRAAELLAELREADPAAAVIGAVRERGDWAVAIANA